MRFIKFVYKKDLEGVDEIDLSQQNLFNTLKGRFLEIVVQVTMMKFNHEHVAGQFFGREGEVEVPVFETVDTKTVKGAATKSYQIDVYGKEQWKERYWLCECKYTKTPMGMKQVRKLERAANALRREAKDAKRPLPEIRLWLVSTGGFTGKVLEYVKAREDIYFSDYEGINGIFQAYGGNYTIPIFKKS